MDSSLITPEDVLETLMNDGTVDALRLKIINQLKANEELKKNTLTMVEQSKVLNTPGAEKQTKRELFDALRQELETPVLEKASKSIWDLILDNEGLGREITETVEKIFCRLSGRDPPLFRPSTEATQETEKDLESEKKKGKLVSSSRKRKVTEKIMQREAHASPSIPKDSVVKRRKRSVPRDKSVESERGARCKRTDGKNWRCSRDIVPNQKYCERHMHRTSKSRSRKPVETTSPAVITSAVNAKESNVNLSVSISPQVMLNNTGNDDTNVSPTAASSPKSTRSTRKRSICRTESL